MQYNAFIDEAEQHLRVFRNGILVSRQEGRFTATNLPDQIGRLKCTAAALDLGHVADVLEALEKESAGLLVPGRIQSDAQTRDILDLIAYAEAEIVKLKYAKDEPDLASFVEKSFDILQLGSPVQQTQPPPPAAQPAAQQEAPQEEEEFEADAEMLEIFSMEADELLANIESNLELLSSNPANRDALWEVRRNAHTFKGAAGIIGLKKPSKLAHRIEDLLDHLAQSEIVPDSRVLELIVAATDCLRAITKGDASNSSPDNSSDIYRSFDEVMHRLQNGEPEREPASPEIPALPAVVPVPAPEPAAASEATGRRPIVRVSIARLDGLVHTVRDLVVSRAAVEQKMADLEAQLEAMAKTTRRLQAANAKIENDFEASMLGSYTPATFLRPRSSYPDTFDLTGESSEKEEFDALEFDRYTDFHQSARELSEAIQECFAIGTSLESLKGALQTAVEEQRRLIEETQEKVMQIRLIRFESIATRLQRAVRVTCDEEHKKAEISVENQEIELDTDVLDSLVEPLMHLIRNSVVHGIEAPETRRLLGKPEAGRITVRISNQETHIELKVSDDGRGIDAAALRDRAAEAGLPFPDGSVPTGSALISLLALPGLTTAERLTMSAGRGVGMGIVKESVEARNGTLSVETSPQLGTTFTIKVPLAFAVTQALLVRSENKMAAVPFKFVKRLFEISPDHLSPDGRSALIEGGSASLPVHRLGDYFAGPNSADAGPLNALMIEADEATFALAVDEILKIEEIAIKTLARPLDKIAGVLGAAVLGSGEIVPVLDVSWFPTAAPIDRDDPTPFEVPDAPTSVLVVDDSPSVRHMTSKAVTAAGWTVTTAKDGIEALELLSGPVLPDVILTDVEMPRMDGYELAAAVKGSDELRHIPVVFITSRAGEKHRERAAELGISEYLTKPFLDAELVSTVERLAAKPVELAI